MDPTQTLRTSENSKSIIIVLLFDIWQFYADESHRAVKISILPYAFTFKTFKNYFLGAR